jgi:diguanylate cyclase (GGDEF)-like protein
MLRPGWRAAPEPPDEAARRAALQALAVLDTPAEPEFDALVQAASIICGTPVSLISLVDAQRQWFKANHGLPGVHETPREEAFCAHAILQDGLFVVPDATRDDRFYGNPLVTAEGGIRFYAGAPLRLHDGQVAGTLCVIDRQPRQLDATQREALSCLALAAARALEGRHAGIALAQRNAFIDTTLAAIADAVLTTDAAGQLTWMNLSAETLLGSPGADLRGLAVDAALPLRSAEPGSGWQTLLSAARRGERSQLPPDAVLDSARTGPLAVEGSVSPLRAAGRQPPAGTATAGAVLVMRDTTEARRASSEVLHRATHDALTGLVNRGEFERRLRQLLATAPAGDAQHCALFIDLDQFKIVNDSCGHAAGDRLLQQIAGMLQASVRGSDTVARMGGDEFAILLLNCPQAAAMALAQKICDRLEGFRFATDGKRFQVGASIGLAPVGGALGNSAAVMQAADESCYAAKEAGRNRVMAWPARMASMPAAAGAANWAERIGRALDDDRFLLFGQLVLPLHASAGVAKVEVLLRMQDEAGAIVAPGQFMPAAERFQLMGRIDRWVLQHTLAWMAEHLPRCQARRVGVNLSGQSIADSAFRQWATDTLRSAGPVLCAALTVEVTESVAIANLEEAGGFLRDLRALGLRVALDDFGAGASAFGYLKRLPLDYLKIDGQFVRDLLTDPLDEVSVRCFIDVARVVGLKTVAECVENAAVLERLRSLGVDFAQGYHLHRPAPLDTLCQG